MWGEKHLNWQEITRRIEMFLAQNLEAHLVDLLLSLVVLAVTYILIKTLNRILNRILQEGSREWAEGDDAATEQSLLSDSMIRSLRILLQTLLLYGGYFLCSPYNPAYFQREYHFCRRLEIHRYKATQNNRRYGGSKAAHQFRPDGYQAVF